MTPLTTPSPHAALLRWLHDGHRGEAPPGGASIEFLREHGLSSLFYLKLGQREHPLKQQAATDFAYAFERRARLGELWAEVSAAFNAAGIESITLGSLAFATQIFGHPAARVSQDVDLLVRPADMRRAIAVLEHTGLARIPGTPMYTRGGLQIDLHDTPGEEARMPALAAAYCQATDALFADARPCLSGPDGARMPAPVPLAVNRALHFFKHYCRPLVHALELLALLDEAQGEYNSLRRELDNANAGRAFACVVAVLERLGFEQEMLKLEHIFTSAEREFVRLHSTREQVGKLASLDAGRAVYRLNMAMMTPPARLRYAWQLAWPPRETLLWAYAQEDTSAASVGRLRLRRLMRLVTGKK